MMIQTVCRICAEPQQILPAAGNEGTFKVIFKEEVSYHLFPPVPTCSIQNTISRLRQVETDEPLPCPKSIQRSVQGLLLPGFESTQWKGRAGPGVCSDPCRLLPAQSTQGEVHTPVLTRGPIPVGQ